LYGNPVGGKEMATNKKKGSCKRMDRKIFNLLMRFIGKNISGKMASRIVIVSWF
jgi:hypothetical protein